MAYDRETFNNKVSERIAEALVTFYTAQLARKNGHTKFVRHWRSEVIALLQRSLVVVLLHDIKGFKVRKKAVDKVTAYIKRKDQAYRVVTERALRNLQQPSALAFYFYCKVMPDDLEERLESEYRDEDAGPIRAFA